MEICFAEKKDLKKVSELSKQFECENCCNGIIADNEEYFENKIVAICKIDNDIVGYVCGEVCVQQKNVSYSKQGDKFFELDEIYIVPNFRNKGIGKQMFEFFENYAKQNGCLSLRLNAVSKNYKSLLKFYIEYMQMNFHSAYLIKPL